MRYLFVLMFALYSGCLSHLIDMSNDHAHFEEHLQFFSKIRHPLHEDGERWRMTREYIKEKFQHYGLKDIREQLFNTSLGIEQNSGNIIEVEGINIIGVREGLTKTGPIIVVGTDYDTPLNTNPLKNNGGGVAIFLETIKLMEERIVNSPFFLNNTIIYVAFDLNTNEYLNSPGKGPSGAYFFVHEWLNRYLESEGQELLGAMILDSVTTYSTVNQSQQKTILRDGFEDAFPKAYEDIMENDSKGNFLGVVYPLSQEANALKNSFIANYQLDRRMRPFRLQEMEFEMDSANVMTDVVELVHHQSHFAFWTNSPEEPLPAILLFDTDSDRKSPYPDEECNPDHCNAKEFLTTERKDFMEMTTNAIVRTLLDLQATPAEKQSKTTTSVAPTTNDGIILQHTSSIFVFLLVIVSSLINIQAK